MVPKWLVMPIGVVLFILLAAMSVGKIYDFTELISNKNPKHTISVSAEGKVPGTPDLATVNLGVLSQGTSAQAVQDENTKKINDIIEFVKGQGISKEDIQTSQFNIYPTQDYSNGKNTITGYQVNQTITVKVHGIDQSTDKLSKVLSGVTEKGANQINGVSLSFDDPDNLRGQAREKAIAKAKQKAAELAKAAGLTLGRVINVSESGGDYPRPYYADFATAMGGAGAPEKVSAPNIEAGSQDVTVTMSVEFEVK